MGGEWAEAPLSELTEFIVDCPHSTPEWTDSGVAVLRSNNIRNGRLDLSSPSFTNEDGFNSRVKRALPMEGDIVLTREAPMGEVCMIPYGLRCCLGQRMVLIRTDDSKLNSGFLLYALQSPYLQNQISWSEGTGTTVSNIRIPVIKGFQIPTPPVDEQVKIAQVLGALDDKIELNRQTNETLEAMAQALFKSWFVDFDPVIDNALAAGNDIPEPFKARAAARQALGDARKPLPEEISCECPDGFEFRDEMGWLPRGWEFCKLGDVLELLYGKSLPARDRLDGPYPVYGSGGISGSHLESIVEGPGIIVGRKGTVGSIYWVDEDFYPIDTVFYVKAFEMVPLSFVYRSLLRIDIKSMGADSAVPGVNRNALYSAPIVRAPNNVLTEFESRTKDFWTKQTLHVRQSSTLSKLRDTLLPKLLSGQLTIPDAEKLVSNAT